MNVEWIKKNESPKRIFSPASEDLNIEWRDDDNVIHVLVVPRQQISEYPTYQADFLTKHIADVVMNERGKVSDNDRKKIIEEINI